MAAKVERDGVGPSEEDNSEEDKTEGEDGGGIDAEEPRERRFKLSDNKASSGKLGEEERVDGGGSLQLEGTIIQTRRIPLRWQANRQTERQTNCEEHRSER